MGAQNARARASATALATALALVQNAASPLKRLLGRKGERTLLAQVASDDDTKMEQNFTDLPPKYPLIEVEVVLGEYLDVLLGRRAREVRVRVRAHRAVQRAARRAHARARARARA